MGPGSSITQLLLCDIIDFTGLFNEWILYHTWSPSNKERLMDRQRITFFKLDTWKRFIVGPHAQLVEVAQAWKQRSNLFQHLERFHLHCGSKNLRSLDVSGNITGYALGFLGVELFP
ncbi:hypothetical protein Tco_1243225 [Tanacetum coccineum]